MDEKTLFHVKHLIKNLISLAFEVIFSEIINQSTLLYFLIVSLDFYDNPKSGVLLEIKI